MIHLDGSNGSSSGNPGRCSGNSQKMFTRCSAGPLRVKSVMFMPHILLCALPLISFLGLGFCTVGSHGLGYPSTIAASYGSLEYVCAVEANGEQGLLCWGKNGNHSMYPSSTPLAISVLSGGNGFMCGLRADTSSPYCWSGNWSTADLIPERYQNVSYAIIASGDSHICAIRSPSSDGTFGVVDCWGQNEYGEILPPSNVPYLSSVVAGKQFTCGLDKYSQYPICWGSSLFGVTKSFPTLPFESLSAGTNHVCGVVKGTRRASCWGDNSRNQSDAPTNITFAAVTTGMYHSCGITDGTHEVICWGDEVGFGASSTLPASGVSFVEVASAPNMSCGIREDSLFAMCWGNNADVMDYYAPPLQLFLPGVCSAQPCKENLFSFNASAVMDLNIVSTSNICLDSGDHICTPCAWSCPSGTFLSSSCSGDADRTCTECSLCSDNSCRAACQGSSAPFAASSPLQSKSITSGRPGGAAPIIGAAVAGGAVVLALGVCALCFLYRKRFRRHLLDCCAFRCKLSDQGSCAGSSCIGGGGGGVLSGSLVSGSGGIGSSFLNSGIGGRRASSAEVPRDYVRMQAFRLTVLRDATNGFKELNELGRGSYGFVYKANLPDGRQVAVKRANAARRIQCRSRDFEAELEVLCKVHHAHLVNLVGFCEEMGERLLVYEFMPHGTLHDHLHGGLAQLSWHLRLKVAAQAARGIEYLHKDASPRIVHGGIKSSNVLLDGEWGARVADFGLTNPERERERGGGPRSLDLADAVYVDPEYLATETYTEKSDVYSFGVVLLEILCGRKAYDSSFKPPNIVEWAIPQIQRGQGVRILDQSLDLPKNVEPLLRVAEIVELCLKPRPDDRPSMSDVAAWLELVGRSSSL